MKFGLPRRLLRVLGYITVLMTMATFLLLIANKNEVINIDKYLPKYLTPSFFQPPSDLYIVDISINDCYKINKNPGCGSPDNSFGKFGDLGSFGGWRRIEKDLTLNSKLLLRKYLNYKYVKREALRNGDISDESDYKVITDLAVYNPELDSKIPDNKLRIPLKVLQEFRSADVFDDEDHENYKQKNIHGNLYTEDSHKYKASDGNKILEQEMQQKQEEQKQLEQKEKEEKEKQRKILEQKPPDQEQQEQQEPKEQVQEQQKSEQKEDKSQEGQKEDKNEGEEKQNSNKETEKLNEDIEKVDGMPESQEENSDSKDGKEKRSIETDLSSLKMDYEIPTKKQLNERGWMYKFNGIWVKYEPYSSKRALTAIDVLFGKDAVDPRPNWNLIKDSPLVGIDHSANREPFITFRRGPKLDYKSSEFQVPLKVQSDGRFKILQVADLHFSTGYGKCRDPEPSSTKKDCLADPRTLRFLERVLDIEKPNLVVLTGDQIFGDEAPDSETAVFKAVNPFIQRKIPFAPTLGNHDDEGSMSRSEIMTLLSNLPYSLAANGPEEVPGVGNYVVNIEGASTKNSAILLYLLDTHKYSPNPKANPGYDWIKESQLKFVERQYGILKPLIDAFSKIHLSMAFFHIPLPEYRNLRNQPYIGENREGVTAPRHNSGARSILHQLGVKVASVGHDHCNDFCLQDGKSEGMTPDDNDKMWLCYGGGSGEGGYGGYGGYIRRLRTYDLDIEKGEIKTWKRLESEPDKKFDEQILVTGGNVVNF